MVLQQGRTPHRIHQYACTYKELEIDVDEALKKADIPQCVIEDGLNPDGELIALLHLAETAAFAYRRSVELLFF